MSDQELELLFEETDRDKDGRVDFKDFMRMMMSKWIKVILIILKIHYFFAITAKLSVFYFMSIDLVRLFPLPMSFPFGSAGLTFLSKLSIAGVFSSSCFQITVSVTFGSTFLCIGSYSKKTGISYSGNSSVMKPAAILSNWDSNRAGFKTSEFSTLTVAVVIDTFSVAFFSCFNTLISLLCYYCINRSRLVCTWDWVRCCLISLNFSVAHSSNFCRSYLYTLPPTVFTWQMLARARATRLLESRIWFNWSPLSSSCTTVDRIYSKL